MSGTVQKHSASSTERKGGFPNRPADVSFSGITGMHMAKSYWEKLKDPRWQKKRLEALQASDFCCQVCYDNESTLHVHHKQYFKGREPWEYEIAQLAVLCESCHSSEHETEDELNLVCSYLTMDGPQSRSSAASLVSGFARITLPESPDWTAYYAGILASNLFDYGSTAKIGELQDWADLSQRDAAGMIDAIRKYAASKTSEA